MNYLEAIKIRKSVRQFDDSPVDSETVELFKSHFEKINVLNTSLRLNWRISRNKDNSFNLFVEDLDNNHLNLVEFGYEGQQLVIYLTSKGIGTLWHVIGGEKKSPCTITFGYEKKDAKKSLMQKMVSGIVKSGQRKSIEELIKGGNKYLSPEIEEILEYARLAPSAMNKQPWEFTLEENKKIIFTLTTDKKEYNYIDLGILLANASIAAANTGIEYEITRENDNGYCLAITNT